MSDDAQIVRKRPPEPLWPYLLGPLEGWKRRNSERATLREVPFPGVPLIFGLGSPWHVEGPEDAAPHETFAAGLHAAPAFVRATETSWSCIELRLAPLAARRILGWPMHELTNRTLSLDELVPESRQLADRLREAHAWQERFALVESFLARRLADAAPPAREVAWSVEVLRRSAGRAAIRSLAQEIGWSHRRLITRFREQVGLTPKAFARVVRFDRAAERLRSSSRKIVEIAYDCGYFDQAHLTREFRELAGVTPAEFRGAPVNSVQDRARDVD
jgi:AraC-like DNA-binding protein